ncbi:MAG TPA: HAMP domain-containing sensor histidine kinase [Coleofasciculaceae cyanobacterium]
MSWTNLAMLVAGLGLGAAGSAWLGRRQPREVPRNSSAIAPIPPRLESPVADAEKRAMAAQLQLLQLGYAMATEMEKFKSGFLARSSHELRSPINSVISLHQLILSDLCENPEEEREFIAQAQIAAEKMLGLLDRLISLSKLAYGTEQLQIQPLSLEEVLAEVQHFTQLQAQNRSLRLEIALPDPDLYVLADPRWLRQVLISLIDMPISLMQEGYIRLKTQIEPEQQQVNIWIEDQRPAEFWRDPIDWLQTVKSSALQVTPGQTVVQAALAEAEGTGKLPSPGLNLLVVQTLLEMMGGRLEILETPLSKAETLEAGAPLPQFTRIQCSLPLHNP